MDSCLVQLTDFILTEMDKGFHTGVILVDLQKAFDTLDRNVLLQKMECTGFKESFIEWFQSYFSNRKIVMTLENVFSDAGLINCGVPQGSILGLLLFLMHINDLPKVLNKIGSYLYGYEEFSSLIEWFIDNKLSIHFWDYKTKTIFSLK